MRNLVGLVALLVVGCTSAPTPEDFVALEYERCVERIEQGCTATPRLFASFRYATRCEETLGCPGTVEHDICGYNLSYPCYEGMPSPTLSCRVTEMEGTRTRTINFSAQQGDFSIHVEGLVVPFNGGSDVGWGSCWVSVVEGNNGYEGRCGGAEPSMEQPCQITNVAFQDDLGNTTITGEIFCQYLPNEANSSLRIEVTNIGMGPLPALTPATFLFTNCRPNPNLVEICERQRENDLASYERVLPALEVAGCADVLYEALTLEALPEYACTNYGEVSGHVAYKACVLRFAEHCAENRQDSDCVEFCELMPWGIDYLDLVPCD